MTRKHRLVQQIRALDRIAGPSGWRWVQLADVANALGMPAPELLRRFVDATPALGIWTGEGVYLELVPSPDSILVELPSDDVISIDYNETDQFLAFLEIVGPVRVPLGWALKVAQLVEEGYDMTNTIEFIGYNSVDELPQDLLWVSTLDLDNGHYRAGYALSAKEEV